MSPAREVLPRIVTPQTPADRIAYSAARRQGIGLLDLKRRGKGSVQCAAARAAAAWRLHDELGLNAVQVARYFNLTPCSGADLIKRGRP